MNDRARKSEKRKEEKAKVPAVPRRLSMVKRRRRGWRRRKSCLPLMIQE